MQGRTTKTIATLALKSSHGERKPLSGKILKGKPQLCIGKLACVVILVENFAFSGTKLSRAATYDLFVAINLSDNK